MASRAAAREGESSVAPGAATSWIPAQHTCDGIAGMRGLAAREAWRMCSHVQNSMVRLDVEEEWRDHAHCFLVSSRCD